VRGCSFFLPHNCLLSIRTRASECLHECLLHYFATRYREASNDDHTEEAERVDLTIHPNSAIIDPLRASASKTIGARPVGSAEALDDKKSKLVV